MITELLARAMTIGREKKFFLLLISAVLFAMAAIIPDQAMWSLRRYGMSLLSKLVLLLLCLMLLVVYVSWSKNLLQRSTTFSFGRMTLVLFLGLMLAGYLVKSFYINKGLSQYAISRGLDTTSYFIQARIFAEGHLNVPSHELVEFFQTGYCINNGKYFSKYPPGWPAILSLGILLKLPWIVNPVLTYLSLGVIYMLGSSLYDHETAWITTIFTGFSPLVIWGSSSYFSEPASLLFSVLFFYAAVRSLESPNPVFPVLAGSCLGIAFLVRPYSAVAIAFPMSVYWLVKLVQRPRLIWRGVLLFIAFLPLFALYFVYNYYQTGSPLLSPFEYYNPFDKPGFGLRSNDTFIKPSYFGPLSALKNLMVGLIGLNWYGLPLLFLFVLPAVIGRRRKGDLLLCFTTINIIVFHFFYFFRSGGRYYYPALFAVFLLAARGVVELGQFLRDHLHVPSPGSLKVLFVLFPILSSLILISVPGCVNDVRSQTMLLDPFLQVSRLGIGDSIIFLKTVPEAYNNIGYYIQNSPDFDDSVLFVRDLGQRNSLLMEYYPNRKYYLYEFDRAAGRGKFVPVTSTSH